MAYSELGLLVKAINKRDFRDYIIHHMSLGFDKITIFDNESAFDLIECIKDLDLSKINIQRITGWPNQNGLYTSYSKTCDSTWLTFIEDDEFLLLNGLYDDNVNQMLQAHEQYNGLCINWQMIGYNQIQEVRPTESLIDSCFNVYPKFDTINGDGWQTPSSVNSHVRTFCRPQSITIWPNPHLPVIPSGGIVNLNNERCVKPVSERYCDKALIYHYYTKSKADWIAKYNRGRADVNGGKINMNLFEEISKNITEVDTRMKDFKDTHWIAQ